MELHQLKKGTGLIHVDKNSEVVDSYIVLIDFFHPSPEYLENMDALRALDISLHFWAANEYIKKVERYDGNNCAFVYVKEGAIYITSKVHDLNLTSTAKSDGSTADYYKLPSNVKELQDLISHKDMNAQIGEIFRTAYRYGSASHSDQLRDAKKIQFYINAEIKRLEQHNKG